ncbi:MAG: DUF3127 domain-containing protein [Muribaculaceae bacterium]|nr:DUF3127 domain-containing protein [Muribaculaceae bacterium]
MDFPAKCIQFLGETTGTSKAGNPWKKKEWVVETFGNFPRKVKVQCFGEKSDLMNLEPGRDYMLSVDLESREFNGRWYTDVSLFRVSDYVAQGVAGSNIPGGGSYNQPQQPANQPYNAPQGPYGGNVDFVSESGDDNLPF